MASQSFIIAHEDKLIDCKKTVMELLEAYNIEIDREGEIYPENRDLWGTLSVNAKSLAFKLNELVQLLGEEFGESDNKISDIVKKLVED